ncbi:MAG TPA: tRNA pseudouridine(38-40) synthase TruA [Gammaproteobacteria bacterium]|nr:tRNA pseudouridine(38-40) synthase TruA [Gammaproteobacteria bacterium]
MSEVRRYALGLEYDGCEFAGWQAQKGQRTVQAEVDRALGVVADQAVESVAAGRTDAGVHAHGQVVHADVHCVRTPNQWLRGANSNLPDDVAVIWAREVDVDFHARYSATGRHYRYWVCERGPRIVLSRKRAAWSYRPLDASCMQAAADTLLGEHDFSAFRGAGCQASTPVRELRELRVRRFSPEWIAFDVTANAFLYHMVRNLVGTLLVVGQGDAGVEWPAEVLRTRDRRRAGPTAPAHGLTLTGVDYPTHYGLPAYEAPSGSPDAL